MRDCLIRGPLAASERCGVSRKCVVMTGGTSGIGRQTLKLLLSESGTFSVLVLARSSPRVEELWALPGAAERLAIVDAALASLASVDTACEEVGRRLGGGMIDALVLNAGIQTVTGDQASADGLELTFAVNFLAHFLIAERLKARLRPGARIITTSSEVHDPDAFCLMGIGRATWQDPLDLADPVRSQSHMISIVERGEARYCASKLLNLMHVRHLARELTGIGVLAFNPSVVPGTDIGRDCNWLQQQGWNYLMPLLVPILPGARGLDRSAGDLLWLIADADAVGLSGQYVDGRVPRPGSGESRDPAKIRRAVVVAREIIARAVDGAQPLAANRA
jgi:NAD(P)-dependent dehydrogenase (short-subunit alcohol dehydrogenase family)